MKYPYSTCTLRLLILSLGLLPGLTQAASEQPAVTELARPDYLPAKPEATFQLPPVALGDANPNDKDTAVLIKHILFRGNTVIPTTELDTLVAPYIGRPLNAFAIETLRQSVSRLYVDRGYVNSGALLGTDAISGNTLRLDIVEGKLTALQLHGMQRLYDDYLRQRLCPDPDAVLNMDSLREQFALLLGDPLFERLNARVLPGANLGEAVLDIEVQRARPYQLSAHVNNYRPPSVGANTTTLSGWVRNFTQVGDVLEASVQDSAQGEAGRRYGVGWHLPLNQRGTQISLQIDRGQSSVIEQPLQNLDIRSTLDSQDWGLSQVLFESLRHKFSVGLNRSQRTNRTTLMDQPFSFVAAEPTGATTVLTTRFWQEYSLRSEKQVLALRSTLAASSNNLQDSAIVPGMPLPASQNARIWLGQFHYARQVQDNGAQFIVRGTLQRSADSLVALERMAIGGVGSVRGFRENQLTRDQGTVLNLEYDYPLISNAGKGLNLALVPFYDWGWGRNQGEDGDTLAALGLGVRLRQGGFKLDFAVARRQIAPSTITSEGGNLQDKGVHLQLGYDFF